MATLSLLFLCTGNKCVCINAATMALIDAGVPMRDFVCACSAGYLEDTPLLGQSTAWLCIQCQWSPYLGAENVS